MLQTLSRGETVELMRRDGSFVEVRTESGVTGFVDAVNLSDPRANAVGATLEHESELDELDRQTAMSSRSAAPAGDDLPHDMIAAPGERLVYHGGFLYDPFGNRALVVTTRRVLIGGGGVALPRVLDLADITSVGLREGSSGMALGERTVVMRASSVEGEIFIAGLRDPERAASSIEAARAAVTQPPAK